MHDSCISKCTYSHAATSLKVKGKASISPANITVLLGTITFLCRQTFGEKRERLEKNASFLEVILIELIQTNRLKYKFLPPASQ